jgi:hypothetical protein
MNSCQLQVTPGFLQARPATPWRLSNPGVEALGELVVDFGKHRERFMALALLREHTREAGRRAQLPQLCVLLACDFYGRAKTSLGGGDV